MKPGDRIRRKELKDGTVLIALKETNPEVNIHKGHWHVAKDGTLLSIKEDGSHAYKRSDVRKNINEVMAESGVQLPTGWKDTQPSVSEMDGGVDSVPEDW